MSILLSARYSLGSLGNNNRIVEQLWRESNNMQSERKERRIGDWERKRVIGRENERVGASETHIKNVIFIKLLTICCDYIAIQHTYTFNTIKELMAFIHGKALQSMTFFPIAFHLVLCLTPDFFFPLRCDFFLKGRFEDNFSSKHENSGSGSGSSDDGVRCVHMCHAKYMQKPTFTVSIAYDMCIK